MELKVIRGDRLLTQFNEDSTYNQLYTGIVQAFPNTRKRQNATAPVVVSRIEYVPYVNNGVLRVEAEARNGPGRYQPVIQFREVSFAEQGASNTVTFRAADGQEYGIVPIRLAGSNIKVRCTCLDFYHRFSMHNHSDGSLAGNPPPPYVPKGGRPSVNPTQTPGVCKHIIKLVEQLKRARIVT
jgi:hypothetical protein